MIAPNMSKDQYKKMPWWAKLIYWIAVISIFLLIASTWILGPWWN